MDLNSREIRDTSVLERRRFCDFEDLLMFALVAVLSAWAWWFVNLINDLQGLAGL